MCQVLRICTAVVVHDADSTHRFVPLDSREKWCPMAVACPFLASYGPRGNSEELARSA